ncbi:MAG: hypothetical protein WAK84_01255 [Candidatus Cybelea sp.]
MRFHSASDAFLTPPHRLRPHRIAALHGIAQRALVLHALHLRSIAAPIA